VAVAGEVRTDAAGVGRVLAACARIARETPGGIEARVHPAMVPNNHLLAKVSGPFNAVCLRGSALGTSIYYGRGAGMMPTATAVVAEAPSRSSR